MIYLYVLILLRKKPTYIGNPQRDQIFTVVGPSAYGTMHVIGLHYEVGEGVIINPYATCRYLHSLIGKEVAPRFYTLHWIVVFVA